LTLHQQVRTFIREHYSGTLTRGNAAVMERHLQDCGECTAYAETLRNTIQEVRREMGAVVASGGMVRHTKSGVRRAAMRMQKREERMSALGIACAIAGLWALLSIPLLWEGTRWLGAHSNVPMLVWETLAVVAWLMPSGIAVTIGVWSRKIKALEG
jgi:anti-sigma factor RsiW